MDYKELIGLIEDYQKTGAGVEIKLKTVKKATPRLAERFNKKADYSSAANVYYTLYKKAKDRDSKIHFGIALTQMLINASNLDKAEKFLNALEKISAGEEKYMGAIWEKRGWIADLRKNLAGEISAFRQAGEIYRKNPESLKIEGHKKDRLLTVEHFLGRALVNRGKKKDLNEAIELFKRSLEGYKKLKSEDAVAYNLAWLARAYVALKDFKSAESAAEKASRIFERLSKKRGEVIKTHAFRIKAELAEARGDKKMALRYALEGLRHSLPAGTYYNGVFEAIKLIARTVR